MSKKIKVKVTIVAELLDDEEDIVMDAARKLGCDKVCETLVGEIKDKDTYYELFSNIDSLLDPEDEHSNYDNSNVLINSEKSEFTECFLNTGRPGFRSEQRNKDWFVDYVTDLDFL